MTYQATEIVSMAVHGEHVVELLIGTNSQPINIKFQIGAAQRVVDALTKSLAALERGPLTQEPVA